ncbi:sugar phosphate isomerase/epimerase family protein [Novosphingobium guangzhouense]|uniref:Xylose isomerase-like TIM barrel domain-containing protein n=1 Tax=Novosphingobium guangzhouense TaxID=1850347 RepID=A0A2K2G5Y4_9SPHN|nr:TIM barrel protein [Novosphingobium guangzhouense]PNU06432.1 hypothetical protein A8V01_02475 [Novosphingobium guangzhouense]
MTLSATTEQAAIALRSDVTFSMPWAMVQHLPFREQVRAVVLAGFQEMSLSPIDIIRSICAGVSLHEMKTVLDGEGIVVGRVDPLTAWVPNWKAHNFDFDFSFTTATDPQAIFDVADHFGAKHVSLNAMWHPDTYTQAELVEHYATICRRAAPHGLTCDIEPIPMWGIPRLEDALKIIELSGVTNSGIVLDTTHFFRGETPLDILASMPGDLVTTVQICDGYMPATASLEDECFHRLWPGEGGFQLNAMIDLLDDIGGLKAVGPEIFAPTYALERTPAEDIAIMARESMLRFPKLTAIGYSPPGNY